jgi:hypothetical protein
LRPLAPGSNFVPDPPPFFLVFSRLTMRCRCIQLEPRTLEAWVGRVMVLLQIEGAHSEAFMRLSRAGRQGVRDLRSRSRAASPGSKRLGSPLEVLVGVLTSASPSEQGLPGMRSRQCLQLPGHQTDPADEMICVQQLVFGI